MGYRDTYDDESAFEVDVWTRLVAFMELEAEGGAANLCLTSHTSLAGRSAAVWLEFCSEERGPDVSVLGSRNRLDIVVKHPNKDQGSIGVEVKCLGNTGHAAKLTQGIGQAMLALAHRDRTLLVVHCVISVPTCCDVEDAAVARSCRLTRIRVGEDDGEHTGR